jgi:glycosyltransferase involved in cell wall biosynthesis
VKLAFVLGTSTGGTARHVRMLAAGCAARGLRVEVFGPAQTDRDFAFSADAESPGFTAAPPGFTAAPPEPTGAPVGFTAVEIADRPRLLRDLRAIARLRRLFQAWRPDVVHAHGLRAGALAAIAVAFARTAGGGPALVVTVHNAPPAAGVTGAVYRVLELIVARNANSVLCVSPDLEDRMRAAGARRVGHAVVPAAPVSLTGEVSAQTRAALRAEFGADPGQAIVLAVGRLAAQKGFGLLLHAAAEWGGVQPEPLLVIAGQGPLAAKLQAQAASLGLTVRFVGQRRDVPALLAAADVFVLPSVWEGQALILQEALRAGVPIVATRVGGNAALLGEDAAILVPGGDAHHLAEAIRAVLGDPALAARLRAAAVARAGALPTADEAVTAALAEYRHVTRLTGNPSLACHLRSTIKRDLRPGRSGVSAVWQRRRGAFDRRMGRDGPGKYEPSVAVLRAGGAGIPRRAGPAARVRAAATGAGPAVRVP